MTFEEAEHVAALAINLPHIFDTDKDQALVAYAAEVARLRAHIDTFVAGLKTALEVLRFET